jgi:hypothetical protein
MKFLALALTAVVGLTEGKKIGSAELNRRMQSGLVNKSVLMRGAKPYNAAAKRKLEDEDNKFEITGKYSIQFSTCASMTVQNDEMTEDANMVTMAANGDLVSEKDYIIFNVCETEYCQYYGEDEKMTFIAEVGTYFSAISQYLPTKVEQYCEACEESYDYCYALANGQTYYPEGYEQNQDEEEEEEESEDEDENNEDEDGEDRKRKLKSRKLANNNEVIKFIDCDMCKEYECLDFHQTSSNGYYNENNEYVEAELDDAIEWLNGFSECSETSAYLDDYPVYSGLMCNSAGTGIEIGLFMDDECTMYTTKLSFKDVMQTADMTYYNMVSDIVEFTFTNDGIECYNPEVTWYNEVDYYYEQMEQAQNGEEEEEQDDNEEEEELEAAEWCQDLIDEDSAVDLYDCDYEAEEEQEDENQDQDDGYVAYDWYSYELSEQQQEDISTVCAVYTGMIAAADATVDSNDGSYSPYKSHTNFNPDHENLFDYSKGKSSSSNGGKVFGWILLVAVVGAAGAAFFMQKKSGGDKKKPLIAENEGTMA